MIGTGGAVVGAVLAAGGSTRMAGGDKLLRPLGDAPIVRHSVEAALDAGLDRVAAVVGHRADEVVAALEGLPVERIDNPDHRGGLSSSVGAALDWAIGVRALDRPDAGEPLVRAGADALILSLADEPEMRSEAFRRVLAAWRRDPRAAARAAYRDRPGHPVLIRLPPEAPVPPGDRGFRDWLAGLPDILTVPLPWPAPPDIDDEEDYRAAVARLPR